MKEQTMDVREKQMKVMNGTVQVEVRGELKISDIPPEVVKRHGIKVGDITPSTRLLIVE